MWLIKSYLLILVSRLSLHLLKWFRPILWAVVGLLFIFKFFLDPVFKIICKVFVFDTFISLSMQYVNTAYQVKKKMRSLIIFERESDSHWLNHALLMASMCYCSTRSATVLFYFSLFNCTVFLYCSPGDRTKKLTYL